MADGKGREISIGRRRTRLLCPDCDELREVRAYTDAQLQCVLSCGDVRTLALLPSAPGSVSLENILAKDELAKRFFPFTYEDKRGAEHIAEQEMRERWAA